VYLDFLLVPVAKSWNVRFTGNLNRIETKREFLLPVKCVSLYVDYISSDDSQKFFNEMREGKALYTDD